MRNKEVIIIFFFEIQKGELIAYLLTLANFNYDVELIKILEILGYCLVIKLSFQLKFVFILWKAW